MRMIFTVSALLAASIAHAESLSEQLEAQGIRKTLTALESDPSADPYALAAVHFLRGAEISAQGQAKYGSSIMQGVQFGGSLHSAPITPETLPALFAAVDAQMEASRTALDQITASDPAVVIDTSKIWIDANDNGTADEGESLAAYLYDLTGPPQWKRKDGDIMPQPVIRFDAADIHWLRAYTHVVSGTADVLGAFDLETPIAATLEMRETYAQAWAQAEQPPQLDTFAAGLPDIVDQIATLLAVLDQRPDPAGLQNARDHFLQVIAENRIFWTKLRAETDNDREWIPNPAQTSALDFDFPEAIGDTWLDVMDDAEAILTGEQLAPFWRMPPTHGINISKLISDPPQFSFDKMFQGMALLPYVEEGPVATPEALDAFDSITGQSFGAAVFILN